MEPIWIRDQRYGASADAWTATDAADRTGASGLCDNDIGKICRQVDDGTRWRCTAVTDGSPTWAQELSGAAAPVSVGTANAEGDAATMARSNHVHDHGAQTDPTHHAVATASAAGFLAAYDFALVINGISGASVDLPSGSGFVDVQSTTALLTVKNTTRQGRFEFVLSEELADVTVRQSVVRFGVAWLNDDTQTIEDLDADNVDSGATPAVTIALNNGVDCKLTLNADQTVTLSVEKDAANARACISKYFLGSVVSLAQAPPEYVSGATDEDGDEITLTWSQDLDDTADAPASTAFTLGGTSATVDTVTLDGATVVLGLAGDPVANGETVTMTYTPPETNPLVSALGQSVGSVTAGAVTNNVPA